MAARPGLALDLDVHPGRTRDRALISAAAAAVASRLVSSACAVLTLAVAAQALTRAELGVVAVLTTLALFLGFGDFGLGTLLMTRLPAAQARGEVDAARGLVATTVATLLATGTLLTVAGGVSAWLGDWPAVLGARGLPAGEVRAAVLCFFVCGGLSVPAGVGARLLAAQQRSTVMHGWNAAAAAISVVSTVGCAAAHASLWCYVAAIAGTPAAVAAIQTVWVVRRAFPRLELVVPWTDAVALLRASAPFAVLGVCTVVSYYVDSLVIAAVLGAASAAVFAVAARMFALVGGTVSLAGQQLWSALSEAVARGDIAWVRSRYRRALAASGGLGLLACLILVVAGRPLARVWVGPDLQPPLGLLIALGVWTVFSTAVIQASYLLAAVERVRAVAAAGLAMTPVNLVLSIALTHRYGLTGPILGSIIAMALVLMVPVAVLTRRLLAELEARPVYEL